MKLIISALLILSCSLSQAAVVNCSIRTNLAHEEQNFEVIVTDDGHGPMETIETEVFRVMVTSSKSFLVVGITIKETMQSMAVHGKTEAGPVATQFIDGKNWVQVGCR